MVVVSEKLHVKRLKENNLVIEEIYKYNDHIFVRTSDGKKNDSVYRGRKIEKNYYINGKRKYRETNFDENVTYTLVSKKNHEKMTCSMCGYSDIGDSFYDGCPYCGSHFNYDYSIKNRAGTYALKEMFNFKPMQVANIVIPICLCLIFSAVDNFSIESIIYSIILFPILIFIFRMVLTILLIPYLFYRMFTFQDIHNQIIRIGKRVINNKKLLNDLYFELLNYYYDEKLCPNSKKLIDFEIIDYKKYKIRQYYNIIYVYLTFRVRKYFIVNGKIKKRLVTQSVRLMENKNVITNTSENIEKCISCGASIDLSKKECEYCGSRTPSPNEWILDYRYIK